MREGEILREVAVSEVIDEHGMCIRGFFFLQDKDNPYWKVIFQRSGSLRLQRDLLQLRREQGADLWAWANKEKEKTQPRAWRCPPTLEELELLAEQAKAKASAAAGPAEPRAEVPSAPLLAASETGMAGMEVDSLRRRRRRGARKRKTVLEQ